MKGNEMQNEILAAALEYAERGLAVIPVRRVGRDDSKAPVGALVPRGLNDATRDAATIRKWWAAEPTANVAIVAGASGIVIIDADGAQGVADFAAWADANGAELGNIPCADTARGGRHYYFLAPPGAPLRPNVRKLFEGVGVRGVDVRAGASYAYAPPSRTAEGDAWAWRVPLAEGDLITPPAALAELLAKLINGDKDRSAATPGAKGNGGAKIRKGERNAALTAALGGLRKYGAGDDTLAAAAKALNPVVFAAPLDRRELDNTARGLARYAPDVEGEAPPELPRFNPTAWRAAVKADPEPYRTAWPELDAVKFMPGSVSCITAHTAHGKTSFLINLALNLASAPTPPPVVFISLEVRELDLIHKFVTTGQGAQGLSFDQVKAVICGTYTDAAGVAGVEASIKKLAALERFHPISPEGATTAADVAAYIGAAVAMHSRPPVVLLDYIQLVKPGRPSTEARYLELAEISRVILGAAKETGAVVIVGAQAKRPQMAGAEEREPTISDVREFADLAHDAALVLGLYSPPDAAPVAETGGAYDLRVKILKNRYGPAGGDVPLLFYKAQGVITSRREFKKEYGASASGF